MSVTSVSPTKVQAAVETDAAESVSVASAAAAAAVLAA
jgi:hypothetical protein